MFSTIRPAHVIYGGSTTARCRLTIIEDHYDRITIVVYRVVEGTVMAMITAGRSHHRIRRWRRGRPDGRGWNDDLRTMIIAYMINTNVCIERTNERFTTRRKNKSPSPSSFSGTTQRLIGSGVHRCFYYYFFFHTPTPVRLHVTQTSATSFHAHPHTRINFFFFFCISSSYAYSLALSW